MSDTAVEPDDNGEHEHQGDDFTTPQEDQGNAGAGQRDAPPAEEEPADQ